MLTEEIKKIHQRSQGTYGAPRIHAELAEKGLHVGRKRVARLMRAADVVNIGRECPQIIGLKCPLFNDSRVQ